LKGLAEVNGELGKYNLSKEQIKCEIGQRTTTMKTTNNEVK
jgi:hypothetical protein